MLLSTLDTVKAQSKHIDEHIDEHIDTALSDTMILVLNALEACNLSRADLFREIGLRNDYRSFKRHIQPLIAKGFIEMTLPDKPTSKLQKYRITAKGRSNSLRLP